MAESEHLPGKPPLTSQYSLFALGPCSRPPALPEGLLCLGEAGFVGFEINGHIVDFKEEPKFQKLKNLTEFSGHQQTKIASIPL